MTLTGDTGYNLAGGRWHIPRSRGALSGLLLMALGAWGALIPFIGPYFDFALTPNSSWTWTAARFWLEVLPGVAAFVGGFLLLVSANRGTASIGAWLAAAAGVWFIIGPTLTGPLHLGTLGSPATGGVTWGALIWFALFYGLGAAILFLAATALGALSVRSVRDVQHAQRRMLGRTQAGRVAEPERAATQPAQPEVYPSDTAQADAARSRGGAHRGGRPGQWFGRTLTRHGGGAHRDDAG
jgi:hypothetical protein